MIDNGKLLQEFELFMMEIKENNILPDDIENVDFYINLKKNSTINITVSAELFRAFIAGEIPSLGLIEIAQELKEMKLQDLVVEISKIRDDMLNNLNKTIH